MRGRSPGTRSRWCRRWAPMREEPEMGAIPIVIVIVVVALVAGAIAVKQSVDE